MASRIPVWGAPAGSGRPPPSTSCPGASARGGTRGYGGAAPSTAMGTAGRMAAPQPSASRGRLPAPTAASRHSTCPGSAARRPGAAAPKPPTMGAPYKKHGQLVQYKPPPSAVPARTPGPPGRVYLPGFGYYRGATPRSALQQPAPPPAAPPPLAPPCSLVDTMVRQSKPPPAVTAPAPRSPPPHTTGVWLPGYGRAGPYPPPDAQRSPTLGQGMTAPPMRPPQDVSISSGAVTPAFYNLPIGSQMNQLPSKPVPVPKTTTCPSAAPRLMNPRTMATAISPPPNLPRSRMPPPPSGPRRGRLLNPSQLSSARPPVIPIKSFEAMGKASRGPSPAGAGCPAAAGASSGAERSGAQSGVPMQKEIYTRRVKSSSRQKVRSGGQAIAGSQAVCPGAAPSTPPSSRAALQRTAGQIPPFTSPPGISHAFPDISPVRRMESPDVSWEPVPIAFSTARPVTAPSLGAQERQPEDITMIRAARQRLQMYNLAKDADLVYNTTPPWASAGGVSLSESSLGSQPGPPSTCPGMASVMASSPRSSQAASIIIENLKAQEEYEVSNMIQNIGDMQSYRRKLVGNSVPNTEFLQQVATPQRTGPSEWKMNWGAPSSPTSPNLIQFSPPAIQGPAFGGPPVGAYSKELFDLVKL